MSPVTIVLLVILAVLIAATIGYIGQSVREHADGICVGSAVRSVGGGNTQGSCQTRRIGEGQLPDD